MSSDSNGTVDFWQKKCQELEKIIKTLSTYCVQVVEKHEELLANYKKNQEQNKMKKARSEEDLGVIDEPTLDENSELAKAFKKIQQAKQDKKSTIPRPAPQNKLSSIKDEQEQ